MLVNQREEASICQSKYIKNIQESPEKNRNERLTSSYCLDNTKETISFEEELNTSISETKPFSYSLNASPSKENNIIIIDFDGISNFEIFQEIETVSEIKNLSTKNEFNHKSHQQYNTHESPKLACNKKVSLSKFES